MSAIVFIGPTISPEEVSSIIDAECWPPAAQGDVYRALQSRPQFIGIIDGYFEGSASVWHKEILWALSEGAVVLGASSMGALRAAELASFGMIGVGEIFEGYLSAAIEDDDEVAVVHAPAELGYMALSEPMVNIRPTLAHAERSKVLTLEQANAMCALAKSLNYPERTWEQILEQAGQQGLSASACTALANWLPSNKVDQKKLDAQSLLNTIKQKTGTEAKPPAVGFTFEHTILWQQGVSAWEDRREHTGIEREVLEELMLSDQQYPVRQRALLRKYAVERAYENDLEFSAAARRDITRRFREEAGLTSAQKFRRWLEANGLSESEFKDLLIEELSLSSLLHEDPQMFDEHALSVVKLTGDFEGLAERARHKAELLQPLTRESDDGSGTQKMHPMMLEDWFFRDRPNYGGFGSVQDFISAHGLHSKDDFYTILQREYLYLKKLGLEAPPNV